MKYSVLLFLLNIICISGVCQSKAFGGRHKLPDSIKATAYYAEIKITESARLKKNIFGIAANKAGVGLAYNKEQKIFHFLFLDKKRKDVAFGKDVYPFGQGNAWNYSWKENETYPLLIATASDSAAHKTLYSGYIYLPEEKKWKLIATRIYDDTVGIKFTGNKKDKKSAATISNRWLLRSNGTWKALDSQTTKPPALRPFSNIDSLTQQKIEEENLIARLKDSITFKEGIFYQSIKEGTGKPVNVSDTVVIHYKGWLFSNGSVFDETKEKPASFPLQRLIRGWQVGLPQCRVGGKIRLYIPSGSAYGIRTFATDIPPNSTLVFDIEVLDAKEKVLK